MRNLITTFISLLTLFLPSSFGAIRSYVLTNWDGLSNANPTFMYQDSAGLLWIGTWDGLDVYDGHDFKTYRHDPNDLNTLSDNVIWRITGDKGKNVWVATDYGINKISVGSDDVKKYYLGYEKAQPSRRNSFSVAVSSQGEVFASATGYGVAHYDNQNDKMVLFDAPGINILNVKDIHCIGNDHILLILNDGNAYDIRFHIESDTFVIDNLVRLLPGKIIVNSIDHSKFVYLISNDGFIYSIDKESCAINRLARLPEKGDVSAIERLPDGSMIVAYKSFMVYRVEDNKYERYKPLDGTIVTYLFLGTQNILWAAIDGKGLMAIYNDDINIKKILNNELFGRESGQITKILEDKDGNIFVASQGNGICLLSKNGTKRVISERDGLRNNRITSLALHPDNYLFIGGDEGIDVLNIKTFEIKPLSCDSGNDAFTYSMLFDPSNNNLWVGTFGNGLCRLHIIKHGNSFFVDSDEVFRYNPMDSSSICNNTIMCLAWKDDGNIWIGTLGGGLDLFNLKNRAFSHFNHSGSGNSISGDNVLCLYQESDSILWVGTSYGMDKFRIDNSGNASMSAYYIDRQLKDNTIHGILCDSNGRLWFSTNHGLSSLDTNSGLIENYAGKDYLQNMEFSNGSCLTASNGLMYFGGVDGINVFDPDAVKFSEYEPDVHFEKFLVRQKPVEKFSEKKSIKLKHNENFFTVSFSAIDFINNENCRYSYILEGFDKEVVDNGTNRNAVFTNVPPGKYTLKVSATNGDGVKNNKAPNSLSIIILRPWWSTFWAYALYLLAIISIAYYSFRSYKVMRDRKAQKEQAETERKHKEETYEAKLSFFTNITHEFGTPLTLITGACDQLSTRGLILKDSERYLGIIKYNAERMNRLISELLEFRKVDTGNYIPKFSRFDIAQLLSEIISNFAEIQEEQGVSLKVNLPDRPLIIVSDKNAIEKILYNLISNAFKYTPLCGNIEVLLSDSDNTRIEVRNSGHGIPEEKIDSVFNRFVILDKMENQAKKGKISRNGIGLALTKNLVEMLSGTITVKSVLNEFTEFSVTLPHVDPSKVDLSEDSQAEMKITTEEIEPKGSNLVRITGNSKGEKIMIVDDDPQIRDLITTILMDDYTVIQAIDGQDALEVLKNQRPNVIITDINMPRIDGVELIKRLKNNEFTKYIPVIILTLSTDEESQIKGYELGIDAFIGKPFHPNHLKAVVKSVLNNLSLMEHYYNSNISSKDVYMNKLVNSDDKQFMLHVTELVEKNMSASDFTADSIMSEMNVSKIGLYRKIKDLTGMSPTIFIRNLRLEKAAHLLATTNETILEIMFQCGFNYIGLRVA